MSMYLDDQYVRDLQHDIETAAWVTEMCDEYADTAAEEFLESEDGVALYDLINERFREEARTQKEIQRISDAVYAKFVLRFKGENPALFERLDPFTPSSMIDVLASKKAQRAAQAFEKWYSSDEISTEMVHLGQAMERNSPILRRSHQNRKVALAAEMPSVMPEWDRYTAACKAARQWHNILLDEHRDLAAAAKRAERNKQPVPVRPVTDPEKKAAKAQRKVEQAEARVRAEAEKEARRQEWLAQHSKRVA